jgi:hypothetical protein
MEAIEFGADPFAICIVTRHRRLDTLLGYVRSKDAFKQDPGEGFL